MSGLIWLAAVVGIALLPAVRRMADAFAAIEPDLKRLRDAAEKAEEGRR